jgi:hypothetical protein
VLLIPALASAAEGEPERPAVESLRVSRVDDGLLVSFRVTHAVTEEVLERVHSGMEVTFRHRVELLGKRMAPLLPRRVIGRTVVTTTVRYDSLTRRYRLERQVLGKGWPKGTSPPERFDVAGTGSLEETETWLTVLAGIPLPEPPAAEDPRSRVRVRCELGRRMILLMFPSTYGAAAEVMVEPR